MRPWLFHVPWLVFAAWWAVRALSAARSERVEPSRQRIVSVALAGAGALFLLRPPASLCAPLWPTPAALLWAALAIEIAGIAFAITAREYLGALWSGRVTLKENHRIVRSGPYRFVRHPIYTGVLAAVLGVVLARGTAAGLFGFAFIAAALGRKIVAEEALLCDHFGDAYRSYQREVRALIPGIL